MRFKSFEWDETNINHTAAHGVAPTEAEETCSRKALILKSRQNRYYVLGQTDDGRYLTVIIQPKFFGRIRVITARDMTAVERHRYQRR